MLSTKETSISYSYIPSLRDHYGRGDRIIRARASEWLWEQYFMDTEGHIWIHLCYLKKKIPPCIKIPSINKQGIFLTLENYWEFMDCNVQNKRVKKPRWTDKQTKNKKWWQNHRLAAWLYLSLMAAVYLTKLKFIRMQNSSWLCHKFTMKDKVGESLPSPPLILRK